MEKKVTSKKMILSFSGNKEGLRKQLKIFCAKNNITMNGLVIDLIANHFKKAVKARPNGKAEKTA